MSDSPPGTPNEVRPDRASAKPVEDAPNPLTAGSFGTCVVVGVGLLGGSIAGAIRAAGLGREVVGVGRSRENLDVAVRRGLVDSVTQSLEAVAGRADLIIFATPVETACRQLTECASLLGADCLVTDVGSVKGPIVAAAAEAGLDGRFVGSHPMAGGTSAGAAAARLDLLLGCTTAVIDEPSGRLSAAGATRFRNSLQRVEALWQGLGSRTFRCSAQRHDATVAACSHLPHLASFALAAALDSLERDDSLRRLSGPGFRDASRLARSDPAMWADICSQNSAAILEVLDRFADQLGLLRDAVAAKNAAGVADGMRRGRRYLEWLDGSAGAATSAGSQSEESPQGRRENS